ncbi:hypothetical protein S103564_1174 [Staphylococcus aureus subsp. aureus 103564]|nr:hypothetical protein S103564_1174 [Staphylococcus aureus subsp. aureus 103564]
MLKIDHGYVIGKCFIGDLRALFGMLFA